MSAKSTREVRILVLAPTGRDASLIADTLSADQLPAVVCPNADTLFSKLEEGAAAAITAEEALPPAAVTNLGQWLAAQPPWSDIPFVVLTSRGLPSPSKTRKARELEVLGNV